MKTIQLDQIINGNILPKFEAENNTITLLPTKLIEKLNHLELPLKNKSKAISKICKFITYINNQFKINNEHSLIVIPKNIWVRFFTIRHYRKFKQILKDSEILTQVAYLDGTGYNKDKGIAKQYRIHSNYLLSKDFSLVIFEENEKEVEANVSGLNQKHIHTIINENLDYSKVFEKEIEHHKKNSTSEFSLYLRLNRALSLTQKRYIKKGAKSNRIYHSFFNLSKVTRECFYTNFYNIDLKNAQPILLIYYLISNHLPFDKNYKTVCESGTFYELFYDIYNNDRELVKAAIYKNIFFGFEVNSEINKRFKKLFPVVHNQLKIIKDLDISLASILQDLEADIFNSLTVNYSSKYYTLFDSIYFNNKKDSAQLKKQILSYGKKYGLEFKLS